jgi:hypothetical protein
MNGERKRGSQIINRDTQRLYFERTLHSLNLCDMIWSASEDVSIGRKKMSPGEKHDEQYMVELHGWEQAHCDLAERAGLRRW